MATKPKSPGRRRDADDDSDLEEDLAAANPHRMTLGMRLMYIVLLLVVAGMVGYLVLIILFPEQFARPSWIGAKGLKQTSAGAGKINKGFELGGVWLGMTPDQARVVYPNIRFEPAADSGRAGVFPHHDGEYQVSFRGPDRGERAYRIRSQHAYATVSYIELLSELGGKYGKPRASTCTAEEGAIGIQCSLQWDMPDVALDALIRTAAPAGGGDARTTLSVTATDLRPDAAFAAPAVPKY
jgi:hypothetical protein